MGDYKPYKVYGLEVPVGGILVPGTGLADLSPDEPALAYRISMAALDPSEPPQADEEGNIPPIHRSTLRILRGSNEMDDAFILGGDMDDGSDEDSDNSDDDEEVNGGPSDPAKRKKAREAAALKAMMEGIADAEEGDVDLDELKELIKKPKGKAPASSSDNDDDDSDDSDADPNEMEDFVVCTLDTERNYQQTLDIIVNPGEKVFFVASGTHPIHLTGNYLIDPQAMAESEDDEDDEDYFPQALEDIYGQVSDSEEDELDGIQNPRIKEIGSDEEEEAPQLVSTQPQKGKNKRPAADAAETLDEMMAEADEETPKLSKKQKKKLKNNKGEPVENKPTSSEEKPAETVKESPKDAKKVQFAKNLEQGPTGSAAGKNQTTNGATNGTINGVNGKKDTACKPGVKVVNGVTVDDRKIGTGRQVKKGNKVGVRYIGKLPDGKVFDSNKKGKPFSFTAGSGEVIKGWDIGVQGMQVGGERRLTIPAPMAYGTKSLPGIPGNSTLVFDVKLLEIK